MGGHPAPDDMHTHTHACNIDGDKWTGCLPHPSPPRAGGRKRGMEGKRRDKMKQEEVDEMRAEGGDRIILR